MTIEFAFRLLGMVVFTILGARFGVASADVFNLPEDANGLVFALVGTLSGLIITPWITTRPAQNARAWMMQKPMEVLVASGMGLVFGLVVGLLLMFPLSLLPDLLGVYMPLVASLVCAYFGVLVFSSRAYDIIGMFRKGGGKTATKRGAVVESNGVLVDTSVIIDGRILEMSKTGFIPGTVYIPQFVLAELQNIAGSSDPMRRQRGRHGLDTLNKLKQEGNNFVQFIDDDPEDITAVDAKLVEIAKQRNLPLMTNDFNLNGVASVQGVDVLNVNELALALQPVLLPGDEVTLNIVSEGRESDQGVGYLQDGTMVVVEGGRRYLDRTIPVSVTRYIRSNAGKMYFAVHAKELA